MKRTKLQFEPVQEQGGRLRTSSVGRGMPSMLGSLGGASEKSVGSRGAMCAPPAETVQ